MSSKILPSDSDQASQPIVWRNFPPPGQASGHGNPPPAAGAREQAGAAAVQQARIQELERELDARTRQAYQQGHAAGEAAGAQSASERLEPAIARFAQTIDEIAGLRRRVRAEAEQDAVQVSIAVARRILHRELTVDPESVLGIVKAAFERLDARELYRVRVNPEDAAPVERHLRELGNPARFEVVPDASLERGSVIFETSRGNLDASISTQLQEIERGFIDIVRRAR
jgi:flagellar assembly protein FliH